MKPNRVMDLLLWSIILIITISKATLGSHCTRDQVLTCRKNMDDHIRSLTNITDTLYLHQMSEELIKLYCSYYNREVKSCYADLRQHCNEKEKATFIGYQDAMDFLCNDNFQGYLHVKSCLAQTETINEVDTCARQFDQEKKSINTLSDVATVETCSAITEFIDCEADALRVTCTRQAETWARAYNAKMYQPQLDYLKCDGASTSESSTPGLELWVIAVIAVAILVFIALLILILVCICRQISDSPPSSASNDHHHQPADSRPQVVDQFGHPAYDPSLSYPGPGLVTYNTGSAVFSKQQYNVSHNEKENNRPHFHKHSERKVRKDKKMKKSLNGSADHHKGQQPPDYLVPTHSNHNTGTQQHSLSDHPPTYSDLSSSGSGNRSVSRYPRNEESDYTQLTPTHDLPDPPLSVLGGVPKHR